MPFCVILVLLCVICKVEAVNDNSGFNRDIGVKTAQVGGTVILYCFYEDSANFVSWYRQSLGSKPVIISNWMKLNPEATVYPPYNERFRVDTQSQKGINHLIIKDLFLSDSATYYCGVLEFNEIEFGQGVFLHVKNASSDHQTVFHQLQFLHPLQLGASVNLSCTVHAGPCAGERQFYWFRHAATQTPVIYPSAGLCVSDGESGMKKCTLNLNVKSVSSSDEGMYHCAVAACGEIVFGNGTRLEVTGSAKVPPVLIYSLIVALAVSIIVLLVLGVITYRMKRKSCSVCKGTEYSASVVANQDVGDLHYAALSHNRTSERLRQEESLERVCVYSRVKSVRQ